MADPVTWAIVLGVAAAGTSAVGMIQQGQAQSANASFQSQVAANNAVIAKQNSDRALAADNARSQAAGLKTRAQQARVRAAIAANGIDVNSGSALDVQEGERQVGALEQMNEDQKAILEAYGYRSQAANFENEAALQDAVGDQAMSGALIGATGSLLGSASSLGFKWGAMGGGGIDGYGAKVSDIVWDN